MEEKTPKIFSFADSEVNIPIPDSHDIRSSKHYDSDSSDDKKFLIDTEIIWSNGISVNNSF